MKKSRYILFISISISISISIILILVFNNTVSAADELFGMTHNDHDALIIGTVISIEDNIMTIKSVDRIVSSVPTFKKEQLWVDEASFPLSVYAPERFSVGDHIIVSLNKRGEEFSIAQGLYKVSSTDVKTLKVENPFEPARGAVLTDFVNSGGLYTEYKIQQFIGGGGIVTRYYLGEETVIYHVEEMASSGSQNEEPQSENPENEKSNHIIYIIGGVACLLSLAIVIIDIVKISMPNK